MVVAGLFFSACASQAGNLAAEVGSVAQVTLTQESRPNEECSEETATEETLTEEIFESTIEPQIVYKAVVVRVIDGDTIVLANDERVRYIGMDTPEQGRPYYQETKAKNEELVKGQVVGLELDVQERDKYGRLLAYVWLDSGIMVNAELLRTGYAQILTIPPNVRYQDQFLELQRQAREAKLGLWGLEETPATSTQEVTPEQSAQQPSQEQPTEEEQPPVQEPYTGGDKGLFRFCHPNRSTSFL